LIYSHKPQRSGRSITTNTNNPPQDPPFPHNKIHDISFKNTIPPVPEICTPIPELSIPKEKIAPKIVPKITIKKPVTVPTTPTTPTITTPTKKTSWFTRIISKIRKIFSWSK